MTRDENWARLERQREEARAQLRGLDSRIIGDQVLRAGFHPYRAPGRAVLEVLVARHRSQHHPPLIPQVDASDVHAVAVELQVKPDLASLAEVAHV